MDGILAPHRETRKSIVATNLLFENTLFIFLICHSNSGRGYAFLCFLPKRNGDYLYVMTIWYYVYLDKRNQVLWSKAKQKNNTLKWKFISREKFISKKHLIHSCLWKCIFINLEHRNLLDSKFSKKLNPSMCKPYLAGQEPAPFFHRQRWQLLIMIWEAGASTFLSLV